MIELKNINKTFKVAKRNAGFGEAVKSKIAVRNFIKTINKERETTVILTTHDMQDIEALTERILLIGKGQILLDGALSELKKRNSTHKTSALKSKFI